MLCTPHRRRHIVALCSSRNAGGHFHFGGHVDGRLENKCAGERTKQLEPQGATPPNAVNTVNASELDASGEWSSVGAQNIFNNALIYICIHS